MYVDRRLLRLASAEPAYLLLSVGFGMAAGVATVVAALAFSSVVARVFLEAAGLAQVRGDMGVLLAAILSRAAFTWAGEAAAAEVAVRVKTDLRRRLLSRLVTAGPLSAAGERTGELATTLVEGIQSLDAYLRSYLPQLALAALVPLMVAAFVLARDLLSGIVLLVTAPVIPVFMMLIGRLAERVSRRRWTAFARMGAHFLDVLQGLTTLKILGRARDQVDAIARVTDRFRRTTMEVLRVAFLSALVLEMTATISTAVVAVEVGLRLLYGHLAFAEAFFVLLLAPELYLPLRLLGARFHAGMEGVAAADRLFQLLQAPAAVRTLGDRSAEIGPNPTIHFHDVAFSYQKRDGGGQAEPTPALAGVSLSLAPGETVALVGPTGAGKSTVASLLLRFADPDAGSITADGVPLTSVPPDLWRRRIAWVPQRPHLFAGTIGDNIRLARPDATIAEVAAAARAAQLHELVAELPDGYETQVGEGGVRLSGGQAQRLALARAFLKDAPILILDEVTSHLDPELEARLRDATDRLLKGRSALVIAHRLATVRSADRIVVLDGGRVVERGVHAELAARPGPYSRLLAAGTAG